MTLAWAQGLLLISVLYLALGFIFALFLLNAGLQRIDAQALDMPWPVRLLILPGLVALWPLMLHKWLRRKQPPLS